MDRSEPNMFFTMSGFIFLLFRMSPPCVWVFFFVSDEERRLADEKDPFLHLGMGFCFAARARVS
jgi:hypothetical protein